MLVPVFVAAAMLAGCTSAIRTAPPAAPAPIATRTIEPGLSEWSDGRVEAAGYVAWVEIEGGFWALHDRVSQSPADRPKTVAVLLPDSVSEQDIAALQGAYVVASGQLEGGASIRMSGPEVLVDKIAVAQPEVTR